jgi:multimeric flavodoxin WrbA
LKIIKVIGIDGSSRKAGNTALLIQTVFDKLTKLGIETELIQLSGINKKARRSVLRRL